MHKKKKLLLVVLAVLLAANAVAVSLLVKANPNRWEIQNPANGTTNPGSPSKPNSKSGVLQEKINESELLLLELEKDSKYEPIKNELNKALKNAKEVNKNPNLTSEEEAKEADKLNVALSLAAVDKHITDKPVKETSLGVLAKKIKQVEEFLKGLGNQEKYAPITNYLTDALVDAKKVQTDPEFTEAKEIAAEDKLNTILSLAEVDKSIADRPKDAKLTELDKRIMSAEELFAVLKQDSKYDKIASQLARALLDAKILKFKGNMSAEQEANAADKLHVATSLAFVDKHIIDRGLVNEEKLSELDKLIRMSEQFLSDTAGHYRYEKLNAELSKVLGLVKLAQSNPSGFSKEQEASELDKLIVAYSLAQVDKHIADRTQDALELEIAKAEEMLIVIKGQEKYNHIVKYLENERLNAVAVAKGFAGLNQRETNARKLSQKLSLAYVDKAIADKK
ncbi:hypothetical protein [Mycoplasmopsis alligatoris]|uniref:Uncharacterized protein n=1 Tax=Mycoplasmopsis alligatoris A21JP2 TaxID=747682 RepID=D4XWJ4_9BACT|nr:hypothetical protein [Mycoplasmopsis alligatoris]EFF41153.1 hypothetical protein MALL_0436 [Mycoplasmopsis alligatoris A21JP2]